VLGGLAVRLELTFDRLEDLQVALGALLECCGEDDEVTMRVGIEAGRLTLALGPFDAAQLERELGREPDGAPPIRRVLETVADTVDTDEREDGAWMVLTKRIEGADG